MRQETNSEMDLLLRRLGRRQDAAAPDDHLDADELNSYAENALPPASRARYTEHLAECARCRDLVVQLSSSAGVVVAQETTRVSEPSALRKFLAGLFSPMVLRYAVPALGLVVVAAIGFIVSRNQSSRDTSVAEVRQQQPPQAAVPASEPEPSNLAGRDSSGFLDTTKSVKTPAVKGDTGAGTGAAFPPPPNNAPVVSSVDAEVRDTAKKVEQRQEEAKEAAPPPPKATPAVSELKKLDPEQPAENRVVIANEAPAEKAKKQDRDSVADTGAAAPQTARRRDITALQSGAAPGTKREDAEEKDKNDGDIRTVAGRRFRKEGNAWIDTDFSSSRVVISVSRGSEQYRALVADEPAIKQIADALGGEILVVWKNRAYRIR